MKPADRPCPTLHFSLPPLLPLPFLYLSPSLYSFVPISFPPSPNSTISLSHPLSSYVLSSFSLSSPPLSPSPSLCPYILSSPQSPLPFSSSLIFTFSNLSSTHPSLPSTHQRNNKRLLEPQGTGDSEHRVQTREHSTKQNDLANPGVDRQVSQMMSKWSQLLIAS